MYLTDQAQPKEPLSKQIARVLDELWTGKHRQTQPPLEIRAGLDREPMDGVIYQRNLHDGLILVGPLAGGGLV